MEKNQVKQRPQAVQRTDGTELQSMSVAWSNYKYLELQLVYSPGGILFQIVNDCHRHLYT